MVLRWIAHPSRTADTIREWTDHVVAVDTTRSSSRRGLLASVGAAIAGAAAISLGRAMPVSAQGQPILVGGTHDNAATTTTIKNLDNNSTVLTVESETGVAISAQSLSNVGIYSAGTTGVIGSSGGAAAFGTGVHGVGPIGVLGETVGAITGGIGVRAMAPLGVALETTGRIQALKISGVATIPVGATTKTITPGVKIVSQSFVLLTPKTNLGGRGLWFTTNAAAGTFTIRISSGRTVVTKVAWLLLG